MLLVCESGDVLGKRQQMSPPPTMLIKDHMVSNRAAHIFTPQEITPLQLNPDTLKQQQDAHMLQKEKSILKEQQRHPAVKYTGSGTPKQSPHPQGKSPPKPEPSADQQPAAEEVKISHEETTQRLRQFIKKRTVNEAFNSTADKSAASYQPWIPSVSNLRKATSEPNIKAKARHPRQKLPAFNRSATFSTAYSPRKELHPALRARAPSMTDEANHNSKHDCSPPFKFPKLESNFFKSLPNMKNISSSDIADKAKMQISTDDSALRSHPSLKDATMESMSGSSLTTFYPSLAKLINGDMTERTKQDIWRGQELMKGLRMPEPSILSSFSPAARPLFPNGSLLSTPPERLDLSSKNILEYAQSQLIQMQQLSQEQEEIKEQQKVLMQQQERILKEQDALRQREVFIRKIFYDASANMAVADHMVSAMINQSHVMSSPLSMSVPDFYSSTKHAEMLLKKAQEQQLAVSQAEQLLLLQRSAGNLKLNSAFGHYNPGTRNSISSQSAPNVQSLAAEMVTDPPPLSGRTGIIYDSIMLKHICTCSNPVVHKESPGRLSSIWARLTETGVANRCARLKSRKATNDELELIHSPEHVCKYGGMRSKTSPDVDGEDFVKLKCGGIGKDEQTIWNDLCSAQAARIAAGSVLELATKVAMGELKNAFALVRPPGHMAERSEAKVGCYFNNVAIAAKYLTTQKLSNRVLIVDWDLEHGNGLQQAFYNDPNVLVINIHRYDNGTFFPRTGHATCEGAGEGKGFNINIPFSGSGQAEYGDPEYLAAFRCVIKPVAEQFCPDIVLIAAGYNAMSGHDSYNVTAECFAFMTQELGRLAEGRIMIALEGGYNLVSLSQACEMCIRSLLGEQITHLPAKSLKCAPNTFAVKAIEECITIHRKYYQFAPYLNHISLSVYDAVKRDQEEVDTITALASLSMQHPNNFNAAAAANGSALLQNRSV
ncbi:histone deacetylase 4-like isoform X5 [Bolinopsis microptera]|uniref:histone deacetylase 4-like isoform X5 n=1 Tax=Bolinopsis microptera TaxID=2820187 RepID=UPI003079091A